MDNDSIALPFSILRSSFIKALFIMIGGVFTLFLLYFFNPSSSYLFPPCPFHALTGLHCPGCGSLRALHNLLHGHPIKALGLNPLMILLLPFIAYESIRYFLDGILGVHLPKIFIPAFYIWIFLGIVVSFWILRNIPFYPFVLLAP